MIQCAPKEKVEEIVQAITHAFFHQQLNLEAGGEVPAQGWDALPECIAARRLQAQKVTPEQQRALFTLVCAMDRARDSHRLWRNALDLFAEAPWAFDPEKALSRAEELEKYLRAFGISQRHRQDIAAWKSILRAMIDPAAPRSFQRVIWEGTGDAKALLAALQAKDPQGKPWFPILRGAKISCVWLRILVNPGGARLKNLHWIPISVDRHTRAASRFLGIANTDGLSDARARAILQRVWQQGASKAEGPAALAGTAAALDPALWFFGKWGCSHCRNKNARLPIHEICHRHCRLSGR